MSRVPVIPGTVDGDPARPCAIVDPFGYPVTVSRRWERATGVDWWTIGHRDHRDVVTLYVDGDDRMRRWTRRCKSAINDTADGYPGVLTHLPDRWTGLRFTIERTTWTVEGYGAYGHGPSPQRIPARTPSFAEGGRLRMPAATGSTLLALLDDALVHGLAAVIADLPPLARLLAPGERRGGLPEQLLGPRAISR